MHLPLNFGRRFSFLLVLPAICAISFIAAKQPMTQANAAVSAPGSPIVKLSENGKAALPIVISAQAGEREKTAAQTLAKYLQRISGGEFRVETSAALSAKTPGIALGVAARFAPSPTEFKAGDPLASEDYILRSHTGGVLLIGASDLALENAVWDFLYRLGYRQFFPGEKWEIVPVAKDLSVALNAFERPDYSARRVWPGYSVLAENREEFEAWNARNRMNSGFVLSTGHAYGNIIRRNQAEFAKHPEYLTKPGGDKFCVSNPGLQQLVIQDSLAQFDKNPELQSLSLDPSDGGNWESDSCPDAQQYKSITDRVITLANVVAEAVTKKYPDKLIGIYAYNEHSPPPTIKAHPHVVPSIATSFIQGGYSVDELFAGWSTKTTRLGVREYYSVNTWDRDLPGRARGGNLTYLKTTVPRFHQLGARFLRAESSDNWGPNGLGYYLLSRLLWKTSSAQQVDALTTDFLQKAFGPAHEPMAEFYHLIDGSNKPLLSPDLIGRLYRQLDKALQSTPDVAIVARLHDLALYVHYVELYGEYSQAAGAERQSAFENLLKFSWRIRRTHMVHTLGLWRDLDGRDAQVKIPPGSGYGIAEDKDPWKSSEAYSPQEIEKFIADGIANNELLAFTPVSFSKELVPTTKLNLTSGKPGQFVMLRGNWNLYTWIEKAPSDIALQVTAGQIYADRGPTKFELFPLAEPEGNSVAEQGATPDKLPHEVLLKTTYEGLHQISGNDGGGGTAVAWPAGMPLVFESSMNETPVLMGGYWSLYFYVPKGTKIVGGYRTSVGRILSPSGKAALALTSDGAPGFWSVPVPAGQDGKLWQFVGKGQLRLMTTPPYLARSAQELLLPKEVVEADSAR